MGKEADFDFTRPHPGSGLMYGPVSHLQAPSEREARMGLEHTCEGCGSFDACLSFGPPGGDFKAPRRWYCADPSCGSEIKAEYAARVMASNNQQQAEAA